MSFPHPSPGVLPGFHAYEISVYALEIMKRFLTLLATAYSLHAVPALAQPNLGLEFGEKAGLPEKSLPLVVADTISVVLGLLGIAAILLILYAGFLWMTSEGNDETVKKAKKILSASVVGLLIILTAYSIARFVVSSIIGATV